MSAQDQTAPWRISNITTNTLLKQGPGMVHTVIIMGNSTSVPTFALFDSTTGSSGTLINVNQATLSSTSMNSATLDAGFLNGLYCAIGNGAQAVVTYI